MVNTIKIGKDLGSLAGCIAARKEAEEKNAGSTLVSKNEAALVYATNGTGVVDNSFNEIGMEFGDFKFSNVYPRSNERFARFYNLINENRYSKTYSEPCFSPVTIERFIAFADAEDFENYALILQSAIADHVRKTQENANLSADEKDKRLTSFANLSFNLGYFQALSYKFNHKKDLEK